MANHKYTSLRELLDASQRRTPYLSFGSRDDSDNCSFPTEMFGELCFRESPQTLGSSIWDLFNPPLPPSRPLPIIPPLHDHAEVFDLNEVPDADLFEGLNGDADLEEISDLNESVPEPDEDVGWNENEIAQDQLQNEIISPDPGLENQNKTEGLVNLWYIER